MANVDLTNSITEEINKDIERDENMIKSLESYKDTPYYKSLQKQKQYREQYVNTNSWDWDQYKQSFINAEGDQSNISDLDLSFSSLNVGSSLNLISLNEGSNINVNQPRSEEHYSNSNIREIENKRPAYLVRKGSKKENKCIAKY